ncbi:alkaline phosphatase family protein [Sulfuracidifex metallicus]|uniref:alkaline phosphatase family protein n=1 Tax=Sulfuracidifex metallicus TaxID=47303 RepID=UPI0022733764|nr:alkaline phosphatase family protein [Sulfuracidifex metallicus]MCY0849786.1 alkaline phosphatase family protein [Sulfuracidifex metallicus]
MESQVKKYDDKENLDKEKKEDFFPEDLLRLTSLTDVAKDVRNSLYGAGGKLINGDKILLILTDGLGWNLFKETGIEGCQKIRSIFPTITITAITTLITAKSPGEHGILGWKVYDKKKGRIVDLLSALRRGEKIDFNMPSSFLRRDESVFVTPFAGSSKFLLSKLTGTEVRNYYTPYDSLSTLASSLKGNRFSFFYIPYIDTISHHYGPSSLETAEAIREVSKIVKKAVEIGKSQGFTVVITSDHGQIDVEKNLDISKDLELLEKVEVPPFGDSRNLMIVSRYDINDVFRKYNTTVLTRDLLTIYTGGGQVPDYAVVPRERITLNYWVDESMEYKGNHGGYSRDELEIPLCIF